jgi:hypothetical protein
MPPRPRYLVTMSTYAHTSLQAMLQRHPQGTRMTQWRNASEYSITESGAVATYSPIQSDNHIEGLSHGLDLLARSYDLTDWRDQRPFLGGIDPHLWHIPYDSTYTEQSLQDPTPWADLPAWEQQERTKNMQLQRRRFEVYIQNAKYYVNLARFYSIPPLAKTGPRTITTYLSACLEAIGCGFLAPPADYKSIVLDTPNKRKARVLSPRQPGQRRYGNHAGTPWMPREWRRLPTLSEWTQADVDYAATHDLRDLAEEAVLINPTLHIPAKS